VTVEDEAWIRGMEADLPGIEAPPHLSAWLADLPDDLRTIVNRLCSEGHGVWVVGGAVRDAMQEKKVHGSDIDLATSSPPEETMALFGDRALPTGVEFGTVTVKGEAQHYEVTTLRTESIYRDGRRPESVAWGKSLREDLSRRDFTINSMAVDVARRMVYDPYQGASDLRKRCIKAVGEAMHRCEEDALRILRAYRFLAQDGNSLWTMSPQLNLAVRHHRNRLGMVAVERHWAEVKKILTNPFCGRVFSLMQADGVLSVVFPSSSTIDASLFHVLDNPSLNKLGPMQRLAVLFVQQATSVLLDSMRHLRTSREEQRDAATFHEQLQHLPAAQTGALRVFAHVLGPAAPLHLAVRKGLAMHGVEVQNEEDASVDEVVAAWEALPPRKSPDACLVDGHWLMQRSGIQQGLRLGRLKNWIHRLQIEHDLERAEDMEGLLSVMPFEHGDAEDWPRLSFP
jgi:tRNA nucleotidyltransferase (CCA-adding enzyme)